MMSLDRISAITEGMIIAQESVLGMTVKGIANDTRKDCHDKLYVAIQGVNFDGHNYISTAQQAGAVAALVNREAQQSKESTHFDIPQIQVSDTIKAMGKIASVWRKDFDIPVLAITGSAGKTTLKELTGCILSQHRKGIVTQGNLNNEVGVPLTLTRLTKEDQFAVIEMGMNHAGEIDYLSNMTAPNVAIINNAAHAHLDDLGSVEAVAYAKGEIINGLVDDGVLIFNGDDEYASLWQKLAKQKRTVSFGLSKLADIFADYETTETGSKIFVKGCYGELRINLPLQGEHNVRNALAAIAACFEMGCSKGEIKSGLANYKPLDNRGGSIAFEGLKIINDTYNANPASMKAAIDILAIQAKNAESQGKKVNLFLVLGDMGELGDQQVILHEYVGSLAKGIVDYFYCCGNHATDYMRGFGVNHQNGVVFQNIQTLSEELVEKLASRNKKELSIVLVKGSRFTAMERVVDYLIEQEKQQYENNTGLSEGRG